MNTEAFVAVIGSVDRIAVALLASSATSNDEPLPEPLPNATTGRYPEGVPARL
jgi:hypothetical protein